MHRGIYSITDIAAALCYITDDCMPKTRMHGWRPRMDGCHCSILASTWLACMLRIRVNLTGGEWRRRERALLSDAAPFAYQPTCGMRRERRIFVR